MGKFFLLLIIWGIALFVWWTIKKTEYIGEDLHANPLMTIANGYQKKDGCNGLFMGCMQVCVFFILLFITYVIIQWPAPNEQPTVTNDRPSEVSPIPARPDSIPITPQQQGSVEIVRVRAVPYVTAQGAQAQMVLVDWKNTGSTTIREVFADITAYDAGGNKLDSGAQDYCIYAVFSSDPGISPGETYTEPEDEGYVLVNAPDITGFSAAAKVEVRITRASDGGI